MTPQEQQTASLGFANEDLDYIEAYFSEREDINETGHPNEEMRCLQAIERIREIHARLLKGRPLPTSRVDYERRD